MSAARLDGLIRAIGKTLTIAETPKTEAEYETFLDALELSAADRASLAAIGPKRLFVYRALVHSTLAHAIRRELDLTAGVLGDRFDGEVRTFLEAGMPRSHYVLDIAFEFFDFSKERWASDPALPPFLGDLARFELLDFVSSAARRVPPGAPIRDELAPDGPVVFHESTRLGRYEHAVHQFEPGETSLPKEETWILVYRDAEYDITHVALTELAGAMLERLLAGATLREGIEGASKALGKSFALDEVARFLADLAERGVLLGTTGP